MPTHVLLTAADLEQVAEANYMRVAAAPNDRFRGTFVAHPLGETVTLTEARTGPLRTSRTARMAARTDPGDLLFFCFHLAGSGRLRQGDRATSLGPGNGALFESRSAWDLDVAMSISSLLLQFPRSASGVRPAQISDSLARGLNTSVPAVRLFAGYLRELGRLADDLPAAQRHDAGLVGIDMLAMALRATTAEVPGDSSADTVLIGMMRRHVRERISDPSLTVSTLARRHHISIRRTHLLFGRIGTTPGAYMREQRLAAAKAMLADPRFARRSVAEIAVEVGILELRTFERAFVRRYGLTPTQWRRG